MPPESLHVRAEAGVEMIVAIDSTARGPALGGCRWRLYPDPPAARRDACTLAAAMTRKAALARLALGGGKAVVMGDPACRTRAQLLALGRFVESLGGRYIAAADMGTSALEMQVIHEATEHVIGLPREVGGCGDPAPFTAHGVLLAVRESLRQSGMELQGAVVLVQGVGRVGRALVQLLFEAGARVLASDPEAPALRALPPRCGVIPTSEVYSTPCDVFSPCGPGGGIDGRVASRLPCKIVCGAANNPLASLEVGEVLASRGVLYVPDFVANAGGLIHLAVALEGGDAAQSIARLQVIPENLAAVLELSKRSSIDPARAGEKLALAAVALR